MKGYKNIAQKLHHFTRKYYTNELIKGSILFFSLGFLYLFFTLFLEYFLWLKPTARTFLFWLFIFVEFFLLIKFIAIPIFKLIGFRKGISLQESSKIIGNHFPEVQDKLLNILQLKDATDLSDLILASIDQKSNELAPISFVKAIDFNQNKKYLKYATIPLLIFVIILFTGVYGSLTQSLKRVVNHSIAFIPPAPFTFFLVNSDLQVIQGKSIKISIQTIGKIVPSEVKIIFNKQQYYIENNGITTFSYTFSDVQEPVSFYLEANGIESPVYLINVIRSPTINNVFLKLEHPNYLGIKNETINNASNLMVPEGTKITWQVETSSTDSLAFINHQNRIYFESLSHGRFEYTKSIKKALRYQISSSNKNLKDYENLQLYVDIVKDEYPLISVSSNIDSIYRGTAHFAGQISDDYGLKKLQLIYYNQENPNETNVFDILITKQNIQTFFYEFPDELNLKKGINYEFFFQVFDNDAVNGSKNTKSRTFNYRQNTPVEVEEELLLEQRKTINDLEKAILKQQNQQDQLQTLQQDLQNKKTINWNDKNKIESFIHRQEQYKKMMQRQTDKLQENLDDNKVDYKSLQEKKEDLKDRLKELKKLEKQQKLLDEIKKIAAKLNKEGLVKKAKELAQQNKQQQRSLEKTLELVKRFYVEQKTMQIANKIQELAIEQEKLVNTLEAQKKIIKTFDVIKKELEELRDDNDHLKEPLELPDVEDEEKHIDKGLQKTKENLIEKKLQEAKKSQMQSSKKMKEMSAIMQKVLMEIEGESMEENMDDLRKVLENLIIFSFQQEQLMNKFSATSTTHPNFGTDLKKQNQIKTYFEHIDDSLYVLSMRLPKISINIQDDLSSAHYNLDLSLENFSENRFPQGISNQRYVMTATNNLADYLSNILNSMQNAMSMKMGKGDKGKGFSLPDLIKKQGNLSKQMKKGIKKGLKEGNGKEGEKPGKLGKSEKKGGKGKSGKEGRTGEKGKQQGQGTGNSNDDLDGELYEIFKQQSQLRQELQNAIKESENGNTGTNAAAKKVLKMMEQLENDILAKGFISNTLQKMQLLNYELLKLDKAVLDQGKDKVRKSTANQNVYEKNKIKALNFKKQFYIQTEILNRQSLPLHQNYKMKVRAYFSDTIKD